MRSHRMHVRHLWRLGRQCHLAPEGGPAPVQRASSGHPTGLGKGSVSASARTGRPGRPHQKRHTDLTPLCGIRPHGSRRRAYSGARRDRRGRASAQEFRGLNQFHTFENVRSISKNKRYLMGMRRMIGEGATPCEDARPALASIRTAAFHLRPLGRWQMDLLAMPIVGLRGKKESYREFWSEACVDYS